MFHKSILGHSKMQSPDPLNLAIFNRPEVKEGMNIYVLGVPNQRLKDGKQCSRCLETPSKLYTCAKCQNPGRLYCSKDCQKSDWIMHKLTCGKRQTALEEQVSLWVEQYWQILEVAQQLCGKPHLIIYLTNRNPTKPPGPPFRVSRIECHSHSEMKKVVGHRTGPLLYQQTASVRFSLGEHKEDIAMVMPVELDLSHPSHSALKSLMPYWETGLRIISTLDLPNLNHKQLHSTWRILARKLVRTRDVVGEQAIWGMSHYRDLKEDGWREVVEREGASTEEKWAIMQQSRSVVGGWFIDEMIHYARENNIKVEGEMHAVVLALSTYKTLLL